MKQIIILMNFYLHSQDSPLMWKHYQKHRLSLICSKLQGRGICQGYGESVHSALTMFFWLMMSLVAAYHLFCNLLLHLTENQIEFKVINQFPQKSFPFLGPAENVGCIQRKKKIFQWTKSKKYVILINEEERRL